MVRHSKNNTASGVFTYAERQMVDYGTKSKRLGSDSKRAFDACYLCLNTARVPMICSKGHISCKECVMQCILEQKQTIERAKQEYAEFQKQEASALAERHRERDEAEVQRYIEREVGLSQVGSSAKRSVDTGEGEEEEGRAAAISDKKPRLLEFRGEKDEEKANGSGRRQRAVFAAEAVAKEEEDSAVVVAGKAKLPSFWIPSLAPTAKRTLQDPSALAVQCQASSPAHALKLKHLVEVKFRTSPTKGEKLCPSCDKPLLNSTRISVLARCGHAVCQRCVSNFVLTTSKSGACVVCQKKVAGTADIIQIESEGTGFTGGGGRMVATRYDSALQA
ncbi:hypothetical protein GGF44_005590 [Coemansia sp. RSA 1694]|nr:hypothetical protein GGF38_000126 [Coemansia sp. RSA 25]KAJ2619723.1 hypothetical protein GGF44_005590 [Coemansia sp. RSA 1694]